MAFDVVLSWFCSVSADVQAQFTRPTKFVQLPTPANRAYRNQIVGFGWPHPLRGMLSSAGIDPADVLRIALMGFSEAGAGLSTMLRSSDAGYLETVIACDAIHAQFSPQGQPNAAHDNIAPGYLDPFYAYGSYAERGPVAVGGLPPGERVLVITHSAVVPPDYASTTDTAAAICKRIFGGPYWPTDQPIPSGIDNAQFNPPVVITGNSINNGAKTTYSVSPSHETVHRNGLYVFGFDNKDPSGVNDHIFQAKVVLPAVQAKILAERWNRIDPSSSCTATGVAGNSCKGTAPVVLPRGYPESPQDASLKCDICDATLPKPVPNPPTDVDKPAASSSDSFWKFALGVVAGTGAAFLARKALRRQGT